MILYDVECPKGHRNEVLLTSEEREDILFRNKSQIKVPCPTPGCRETASKDPIAKTGNNSIQWRRAAHGQ